jgi:hypothetical protein
LRKALRMARRWKVLQTVPEIPRLNGERERSFVFTETLRKKYEELAPEPLNSFIQFSCEIGICEGEIIDLVKADVHTTEKADEWGHYGYLQIRKGNAEITNDGYFYTASALSLKSTAWIVLEATAQTNPNNEDAAEEHHEIADAKQTQARLVC